jgi:hypothetical protein
MTLAATRAAPIRMKWLEDAKGSFQLSVLSSELFVVTQAHGINTENQNSKLRTQN